MHAFIRLIGLAAVSCSVVFLSACAGVSFYKEADLKNRTGIPVYAADPYLLVARTGAKDKPVEASIVYITNSERVVYAKPRSGFGSSNLTLTLTGGQLTSFGQQTDTKIPELITSLAGLVTARAGAEKTGAEADAILHGLSTQQSAANNRDIAKKLREITDDMTKRIRSGELKELQDSELNQVRRSAQSLLLSATALDDPSKAPLAQKEFDNIKAQADLLAKIGPATGSTSRDLALQHVQVWASSLQALFKDTVPQAPDKPAFELYKIHLQGGIPMLIPVTTP